MEPLPSPSEGTATLHPTPHTPLRRSVQICTSRSSRRARMSAMNLAARLCRGPSRPQAPAAQRMAPVSLRAGGLRPASVRIGTAAHGLPALRPLRVRAASIRQRFAALLALCLILAAFARPVTHYASSALSVFNDLLPEHLCSPCCSSMCWALDQDIGARCGRCRGERARARAQPI